MTMIDISLNDKMILNGTRVREMMTAEMIVVEMIMIETIIGGTSIGAMTDIRILIEKTIGKMTINVIVKILKIGITHPDKITITDNLTREVIIKTIEGPIIIADVMLIG